MIDTIKEAIMKALFRTKTPVTIFLLLDMMAEDENYPDSENAFRVTLTQLKQRGLIDVETISCPCCRVPKSNYRLTEQGRLNYYKGGPICLDIIV